jgi:hypothetical protein
LFVILALHWTEQTQDVGQPFTESQVAQALVMIKDMQATNA